MRRHLMTIIEIGGIQLSAIQDTSPSSESNLDNTHIGERHVKNGCHFIS